MSDAIKVEVTAADIRDGKAADCQRCPVARALRRATKDDEANVQEIEYKIYLEVWGRYIEAPYEAWQFVRFFDNTDDKGDPFTFELPSQDDAEWKEQCYGCEELVEQSEVDDEGYCAECAAKES